MREISRSPIEKMSEETAVDNETTDMTANIKKEEKKTILFYAGEVVTKYIPLDYKVSLLRKTPSTWKFFSPNTKYVETGYQSDVVCILPQYKSDSIAKTAHIFSFE